MYGSDTLVHCLSVRLILIPGGTSGCGVGAAKQPALTQEVPRAPP